MYSHLRDRMYIFRIQNIIQGFLETVFRKQNPMVPVSKQREVHQQHVQREVWTHLKVLSVDKF